MKRPERGEKLIQIVMKALEAHKWGKSDDERAAALALINTLRRKHYLKPQGWRK